MKNSILLLLVVILAALPLFFIKDSEFAGADEQAEEQIGEIAPAYEPWFESFWEPPGGETESLLFALQAAIGALVIGYVFGYWKARKNHMTEQMVSKKHDVH